MSRVLDLGFSRLMLGACQLGLPYGVANRKGQPSYEEAKEIIARAFEGGVNCIDTASGYGTSEEIIGRALRDLGLAGKMIVVTKVRRIPDECRPEQSEKEIVSSVHSSLNKLRLERLPVCLIHHERSFGHADTLCRLKEKGLVEHIGCSVERPAKARPILESGKAEAMQLPFNLLDQRFRKSGLIESAAGAGQAIFARSTYLQGILQMSREEIPPYLSGALPACRVLHEIAGGAGLTLPEMALRYSLAIPGITSTIVGVETAGQLEENLRLVSRGPLEPELVREINRAVPDLPEELLIPNLWPRDDDPFKKKPTPAAA